MKGSSPTEKEIMRKPSCFSISETNKFEREDHTDRGHARKGTDKTGNVLPKPTCYRDISMKEITS